MANATVYLEDIVSVSTPSSSPKASDKAVYLEDIQPVAKKAPSKATSAAGSTANANGKRQRTLLDMQFAPDTAKRQKLASQPAYAARFTAGPSKPLALQKLTNPTKKLNSIPFSLSAFVAALPSDETRALLALECDVLGKSWLKVLAGELTQAYFLALKRFLYTEGVRGAGDPAPARIYPAPKNIYAWSDTPLGRVKVVILGQDPYPGAGQAHGLSFSVPKGVGVPGSLQNIYTELQTEYPGFTRPAHGHLAGWAAQGVLLLNTVLTVRAGAPASHAERGWEAFTERVLKAVDAYGGANVGANEGVGRGVVVMAWGAKAAKRVGGLDARKHLILKSAHPSPKSAANGFFGNGHFKAANEWLEARYGKEEMIDWGKL